MTLLRVAARGRGRVSIQQPCGVVYRYCPGARCRDR